jgi:hypothetical protein
MLDQSDIHEIIKLLQTGLRNEDWEQVTEAIDYLSDFLEENDLLEE